MALVVDTSFLIDLQKGRKEAKALLADVVAEGELLFIPTIVMAEFLIGVADPLREAAQLERAGEVIDLTREDAIAAAQVGREALARGEFPGWTDCLIAGIARNRGDVAVLTGNPRHFPRARSYS